MLGLTEMFPEQARNLGYNLGACLCSCVKGLYLARGKEGTIRFGRFRRIVRVLVFGGVDILQFVGNFVGACVVRSGTSANGRGATDAAEASFVGTWESRVERERFESSDGSAGSAVICKSYED